VTYGNGPTRQRSPSRGAAETHVAACHEARAPSGPDRAGNAGQPQALTDSTQSNGPWPVFLVKGRPSLSVEAVEWNPR
jgi:hypothetical protein